MVLSQVIHTGVHAITHSMVRRKKPVSRWPAKNDIRERRVRLERRIYDCVITSEAIVISGETYTTKPQRNSVAKR